nr:hydrogenase maturation protease [Candidatus Sulfomarinibacteraceae bacterium]
MTAQPLVIGFGNTLRRDDGVGPRVARRLAEHGVATVIEAFQLLPEHIEAAASAGLVVLVDAAVDLAPGEVRRRKLDPAGPGSPTVDLHELPPEALATAARELYGSSPEVWLISVGVADLELGEGLSSEVEDALPRAAAAVLELVG